MAFHKHTDQAALNGGEKNNGTNIFFKLNQKKADGPFHFLGDMEIYIIP